MKDYPRSFYYKAYKIFCKLLRCEAICFGKLSKRDKRGEVIYGEVSGMKMPLYVFMHMHGMNGIKANAILTMKVKKHANGDSNQIDIVKRIMKALESSDVWIDYGWNCEVAIKQGTCVEELVIGRDLEIKR